MTTAPAPSSLQRLRAKTDRQLAVLVRRELDRGLALANQARPCDARRSYMTAETLLAMTELSAADRVRLQQRLDQLRDALPRCAMSAA
ncbi:MAG TPA: hypothetical protein VNY05_10105 [Candidatus Acidoferrales bacterium]|nr:hypothetical protein [Candidatus Acidoferrales bacterium]